MDKQNGISLVLILVIIAGVGVLSILGTLLYMSYENRIDKGLFDFQIVLPEGSVFTLENIKNLEVTAEIAPTIWFKESEEVEVSLAKKGKYEFTDSFVSESKPFGMVNVSGNQQKEDGSDNYLEMYAYVFYRPLVEENLTQQEENSLSPYLWEENDSLTIDSRSTAIACLINNYLVFSATNAAESPFIYTLPSSMDTLSDLPELLSHSKFTELHNEAKNFLLTGIDSFLPLWFDDRISDLALEILELEEYYVPTEEDFADLPQAKDAEITFQLGQELWKLAVGLENFDQFGIAYPAVRPIANKVAQNGGKLIIQKPSSSIFDFCAYSRLNEKRDSLTSWYCIEADGAKCYLTADPSASCNQNSYTCSCSF